mgnify:CR=1 FL=1
MSDVYIDGLLECYLLTAPVFIDNRTYLFM